MKEDVIAKLREIGLNQLEAEVYYLLLEEEPMTAYKVGKFLNKPTANIYKAVDVLSQKGAVVFEEGKNKLVRAIAPSDFIALQQRDFVSKTVAAADALAEIKPRLIEEGTYRIDSVGLAVQRVKAMIDSATTVIVVDAFPSALDAILENIENALKRGVDVLIQAYGSIKVEGAEVFITENYDQVLEYWNSEQLNIIVDGKESVVALFDRKLTQVFEAVWSTNVYLSCVLHAGRVCEQSIHQLLELPDSADKLEQIENILAQQRFLRNTSVPGVATLFDRYKSQKP